MSPTHTHTKKKGRKKKMKEKESTMYKMCMFQFTLYKNSSNTFQVNMLH